MELYPPFPTCREDTPKRQAEKQIYEAFQACDFDGRVLYEVRPLPTAPQLDFAVWIVGVGIFGIQVKGGKYRIIDGQWFLITDRGRSLRESPVPGTWDAAMAIRDVIRGELKPAERSDELTVPGPAGGDPRPPAVFINSGAGVGHQAGKEPLGRRAESPEQLPGARRGGMGGC